jgi:hypothetical protein
MGPSTGQLVKELLAQGKGRDEIKAELIAKGVSPDSVEDMLDILVPVAIVTPLVAAQPEPQPVAPAPVVTLPPQPVATPVVPAPPLPQPQVTPTPAVAAATPAVPKKKSKLKLIIAGLVVVAAVTGGGVYAFNVIQGASYQTVIHRFITAMQKQDKKTADSLESSGAKALVQQYAGTTSFYDACKKEGQICTASFSAAYLAKGTSVYKDYTSSKGVKGKELVYTIKQSLSGAAAGGLGCNSNSTETLSIAAIPSGNTWLIDDIDEGINANASLCTPSSFSSSFSVNN